MPGALDPESAGAKPPWWPVGTVKFAVMTLGTLGLYHYYWLYENWKWMRARAPAGAGSPFWRTFFAPFTTYRMFDRVRLDAQLHVVKAPWSALGLAAAYFVANVAMLIGVPVWLIGVVLLMPVLPVQLTMERLNRAAAPKAARNDRFTSGNVVFLLLGLALTAAAYASDQYVNQLLQEWQP